MDALRHKLVDEVKIVLQCVLGLLGIGDVARVANNSFNDATSLLGCINTEFKTQGVRSFSVNPGVVTTEAVKATLGDDGVLAQRYGASTPEEIAAALFWLGTEEDALPLAKSYTMIDLQPLYKERVAAVAE